MHSASLGARMILLVTLRSRLDIGPKNYDYLQNKKACKNPVLNKEKKNYTKHTHNKKTRIDGHINRQTYIEEMEHQKGTN